MDDLISRKALIAEYDRVHVGEPGKARKLMEESPKVDAVEVVHGRWSDWENDPMWQQCTACEFIIQYSYSKDCKFCPNCGADMRERKDNDNK